MTEAWSCSTLRIRSDFGHTHVKGVLHEEALQTIQFEWIEEGERAGGTKKKKKKKKESKNSHVSPPLHSTYGVVYLISMFVSVSYSVYF